MVVAKSIGLSDRLVNRGLVFLKLLFFYFFTSLVLLSVPLGLTKGEGTHKRWRIPSSIFTVYKFVKVEIR